MPELIDIEFRGERLVTPYSIRDGRVFVDGDMMIGTVDEVFPESPELLANRVLTVGELWPSTVIPVEFDTDVDTDQQALVTAAMNRMSHYTPLRYLDITGTAAVSTTARLFIMGGDKADNFCWSDTGFNGAGNTVEMQVNNCSERAFVHELGHAAGLYHEHQRSDRGAHVTYEPTCADPPDGSVVGQFGIEGLEHGPYNIDSIMHYDSFASATKDNLGARAPDEVVRDTTEIFMRFESPFKVGTADAVYQDAFREEGVPFFFRATYDDGAGTTATFEDESTTGSDYLLVPRPVASTGDFSGGEYVLVLNRAAVETALGGVSEGDVEYRWNWTIEIDPDSPDPYCPVFLKGSLDVSHPDAVLGTGLFLHTAGDMSALWDLYAELDQRQGLKAVANEFGTDVATGDFDGDGLTDLAVAIPGEAGGAVNLYRGTYVEGLSDGEAHFVPWERLFIPDAEVLAAGDFNGDGYDDLAVGSPGFDAPLPTGGTLTDVGGVLVLMGSDRGIEHGFDAQAEDSELLGLNSNIPLPTERPYMSGSVVDIYRLSAVQDLMLSSVSFGLAPFHQDLAPFVAPSTSTNHWQVGDFPTSACDKTGEVANLFVANARIGASLHGAELDNNTMRADLLVGAPGAHSYLPAVNTAETSYQDVIPWFTQTGAVVVLTGVDNTVIGPLAPLEVREILTPYTVVDPWPGHPIFKGSHEDAEFGAALATGDLDGDGCADVLVGAPNDHRSLIGATPLETDGGHRGPAGFFTRTGRVFGFKNGGQDGVCLSPAILTNSDCPDVLFAEWQFEDEFQQEGAEYGYSVAVGDGPSVIVGAPAYDYQSGGGPTVPEAGMVEVWQQTEFMPRAVRPSSQRWDQGSMHGSASTNGDGPEDHDRYGHALDYGAGELLVGVPNENSKEGGFHRVEDAGTAGFLLPTTGVTTHSFMYNAFTAAPSGVRVGTFVHWADWEGDPATTDHSGCSDRRPRRPYHERRCCRTRAGRPRQQLVRPRLVNGLRDLGSGGATVMRTLYLAGLLTLSCAEVDEPAETVELSVELPRAPTTHLLMVVDNDPRSIAHQRVYELSGGFISPNRGPGQPTRFGVVAPQLSSAGDAQWMGPILTLQDGPLALQELLDSAPANARNGPATHRSVVDAVLRGDLLDELTGGEESGVRVLIASTIDDASTDVSVTDLSNLLDGQPYGGRVWFFVPPPEDGCSQFSDAGLTDPAPEHHAFIERTDSVYFSACEGTGLNQVIRDLTYTEPDPAIENTIALPHVPLDGTLQVVAEDGDAPGPVPDEQLTLVGQTLYLDPPLHRAGTFTITYDRAVEP